MPSTRIFVYTLLIFLLNFLLLLIVNFLLFWRISCTCLSAGEHLQESFPVLQQVFLASLKDSSAEVRRTALQAVAAMVPWLDDEPHIALFKDLVPLTIQV